MRTRRVLVVALAVLAGASAACSAILGLEPPPAEDAGADGAPPVDATMRSDAAGDAPGPDHDAGLEAAADVTVCLGVDAGGDGTTTYYSLNGGVLDDAGTHAWTYFEPNGVNALAHDFQGGVFDGRYVYLAASANGTVTRYDTHGSFVTFSSWSTFDTSTLATTAQGFNGAVYDGRFVYFVPSHAPGVYDGLLVRYDTAGAFSGPGASWSVFDLGALPVPDGGEATVGFGGGTFDGRVVYFTPYSNGVQRLTRVVQYDPDGGSSAGESDGGDAGDGGPRDGGDAGVGDAGGGDGGPRDGGDAGTTDGGDAGSPVEAGPEVFAAASQFSTFDVSTKSASAAGFLGALFDGHYVYLVPFENGGGYSGLVARYDVDASFVSASAWSTFDTTTINADAYGFTGAAFDGRFVYLVPHVKTVVARYDTTAGPVTSKAAWSTFDLAALPLPDAGAPAFSGGAFDGRFVYFVPSGTTFGTVVRYDTWSTFESDCAWSQHDMTQDVAAAANYFGAVYDGQFLYFLPKGTWVARYDTKSPGAMPLLPAFNGSFY